MTQEEFIILVEKVLDALPQEIHRKLDNLAVVVEDLPVGQLPPEEGTGKALVMGAFMGVPLTARGAGEKPYFYGPDRIVLFQKNIEAVCDSEIEIRREIRQTLLHELGHYFGMSEEQLSDV